MICAKNHIKARFTQRSCVQEFGHVGVIERRGWADGPPLHQYDPLLPCRKDLPYDRVAGVGGELLCLLLGKGEEEPS